MKIKPMHSKRLMILLIAFTILIVCSVISILNRNEQKSEKVLINASWSYSYADVGELSVNSDCIAIIEVKDNGTTDINNIVPETLFSVEVKRPIYNCETGDKLSVYMTGGIKDNKIFEIADDPLMKKGDQYLIFAKKNKDGSITALSGPQGRMLYRNGKISSLNGSTIKLDNVSEEILVNEIIKYISKK